MTAIAVALLEREQSSRESEWRPAVTKANNWLGKQPGSLDSSGVLQKGDILLFDRYSTQEQVAERGGGAFMEVLASRSSSRID